MPRPSKKQQKDVVHKSATALLIIDMLNTLDFPQGKKLLQHAKLSAQRIFRLKVRARKKRVPVIYVNDNFGQWQSDRHAIYERCVDKSSLGRPLALPLEPDNNDYFVLKPKHSAFYSTTLAVLLEQMGVTRLIITGIATDICLLFSVHDAYVRNYEVVVPADCTAAELTSQKTAALKLMKKVFHITTPMSAAVRF